MTPVSAFSHIAYSQGPLRSTWAALRDLVAAGRYDEAILMVEQAGKLDRREIPAADRQVFSALGWEVLTLSVQFAKSSYPADSERWNRLLSSIQRRQNADQKPVAHQARRSCDRILWDLLQIGSLPQVREVACFSARTDEAVVRVDHQVATELVALLEELARVEATTRERHDIVVALKLLKRKVRLLVETTAVLETEISRWSTWNAPKPRAMPIPPRLAEKIDHEVVKHRQVNPTPPQQVPPAPAALLETLDAPPARSRRRFHRMAQRRAWWSCVGEFSAPWLTQLPTAPFTDLEELVLQRLVVQGESIKLDEYGRAIIRAIRQRHHLPASEIRRTVVMTLGRRNVVVARRPQPRKSGFSPAQTDPGPL